MWLCYEDGNLRYESEKYVDTSEFLLLFDGEVYDDDYNEISLTELYQTVFTDPDALYTINGQYSCIIYFKLTSKMIVFNDLFGMVPIFYYCSPLTVLIASSFDIIMNEVSTECTIDFVAWSQMVSMGTFLGNATPVKEIHTLFRTEVLTIDAIKGVTKDSRYYDRLKDITINNQITFAEATDKVVNLLQSHLEQVCTHFIDSSKIVFLSGGWDSRLLCALLQRVAQSFVTITSDIDNGNSKDYDFAKIAASFLNIDNQFQPLKPDYFESEIQEYLSSVDYSTMLHQWMNNFLNHNISITNSTINFDGLGGDNLLRRGNSVMEPEHLYDKANILAFSNAVTWPMRNAIEHLAKKSCQHEHDRINGSDNAFFLYILDNRYMRNIAYSLRLQRNKMKANTPFLYRQLIEYILSIPVEIRHDDSFYPAILDLAKPELSQIVSTNSLDPSEVLYKRCKPIKINPASVNIMEHFLMQHSNENMGFVAPLQVRESVEKLRSESTHSFEKLKIFNSLEPFLCFSIFVEKFRKKLAKTQFFHDLYYSSNNEFMQLSINRQSGNQQLLSQYKDQISKESKLDVLITMDVEAYPPCDMYSVHTAKQKYIENLIFAKEKRGLLSRMCFPSASNGFYEYIWKNNLPITFFFDVYSDIYRNDIELKHAICYFNKPFAEIGLHCHPFSLSSEWYETKIKMSSFLSLNDYDAILKYGKVVIDEAIGHVPTSFRSGSFWLYPELFSALKNNDFRVDSSLYYQNAKDYSRRSLAIGNNVCLIENILEVPVTTFTRMESSPKPQLFDFNATTLEDKLKLLVQSAESGNKICTMLMHSWSLCNTETDTTTGKLSHSGISSKLLDEFKWLIEFIQQSPHFSLKRCKDISAQGLTLDKGSIIKLGEYRDVETVQADYKEYCFTAHSPNISIKTISGRELLMAYRYESGASSYIQLFDGAFSKPASDKFMLLAKLIHVKYIEFGFEIFSESDGEIVVFFMEYDQTNRIQNNQSRYNINQGNNYITATWRTDANTLSFKIAIRYKFNKDTDLKMNDLVVTKYFI